MREEQCKSYADNSLVCRSGFVQKPICGGNYGCHTCGHVSEAGMPNCMGQDIPEHLFKVWEYHQT